MLKEVKLNRATIVKCVTGDDNFKQGEYYVSIGWNNGIGVQYENKYGDCVTFLCCCGGIGAGELNNFDNSGKPSFVCVNAKILVEESENEPTD
jgi:hypothetical protein